MPLIGSIGELLRYLLELRDHRHHPEICGIIKRLSNWPVTACCPDDPNILSGAYDNDSIDYDSEDEANLGNNFWEAT